MRAKSAAEYLHCQRKISTSSRCKLLRKPPSDLSSRIGRLTQGVVMAVHHHQKGANYHTFTIFYMDKKMCDGSSPSPKRSKLSYFHNLLHGQKKSISAMLCTSGHLGQEQHPQSLMNDSSKRHPKRYHTRIPRICLNPLSTGQSKIGRRRPIKLDNHCVFISQRISTNEISLERSFSYLNVHILFLKIGQELTPLQLFEVTWLIDFGVDRSTNVTRGRDFAHCIAMVTRNVLECIQQMTARIQAVD